MPSRCRTSLEHDGDVGVESCTRTAAPDWYFASGTTVDGSQQELLLFNPFGDDAIVDVSFITDTGAQEPAGAAGARRAATVAGHGPRAGLGAAPAHVAAHVHARTGRVVAEQTQIFDDVVVDGASLNGIALSLGTTAPATVCRGSPPGARATVDACSSRWPTSP